MTRRAVRTALVAFALFAFAGPVVGGAVPEPSGYRTGDYRAPVPATLAGATVVDTGAAHALWKTGAVLFVDVLPRPPKPANLPEGTVWRDKKRLSIPGAIWLPNTGFGELAEVTNAYFRDGLARAATGADQPLVFFCLAECWMSWNAAKRAMEDHGYSRIFWYPDGTDGWTAAGHPVEEATPVD